MLYVYIVTMIKYTLSIKREHFPHKHRSHCRVLRLCYSPISKVSILGKDWRCAIYFSINQSHSWTVSSLSLGRESSELLSLPVPDAPKLQGPVAVYTWEGNQVNITCEVFAYPTAVISWFRDGQLLPSSNYSNIRIYNTPTASYLEVRPWVPCCVGGGKRIFTGE